MSEKWNMRGNKASMVCGRIGGCGVVTEKHSMVKHRKGRDDLSFKQQLYSFFVLLRV